MSDHEEEILLEDIIDCANRISNWNDNAKVKEKIREQLAEAHCGLEESWRIRGAAEERRRNERSGRPRSPLLRARSGVGAGHAARPVPLPPEGAGSLSPASRRRGRRWKAEHRRIHGA